MTEPNGSPAPDETEKPKGIPEVDVEQRLINIGYTVNRPFAPGEIFVGTAPFWKIKQLAAAIATIEANAEAQAQQERQQKILAPEQVRRDWRRILGGKGKAH